MKREGVGSQSYYSHGGAFRHKIGERLLGYVVSNA